jgi:hypothetical protein
LELLDAPESISSNSSTPPPVVLALGQTEFNGVNVFVVFSTLVVGGSHIKVGFGIGKMVELHLRLVFKAHDGQEAAFLTSVKNRIVLRPISMTKVHANVGQEAAFLSFVKDRTMIVCPTALTENKSTGNVVLFGDLDKSPTIETECKDLAEWLVNNGNSSGYFGMMSINITCVK